MDLTLERELLRRARAGDAVAWDHLVTAHFEGVERVLRKRAKLVQPNEVDDLIQETFLRAQLGLAKFREDSRLYTWLVAIAINLALKARRRRSTSREVVVAEIDQASRRGVGPGADDPEVLLCAAHDTALFDQARASLKPRLREVFDCVDVDELKLREAAELLGIPQGTVASRLAKARKLVRKYLVNAGASAAFVAAILSSSRSRAWTASVTATTIVAAAFGTILLGTLALLYWTPTSRSGHGENHLLQSSAPLVDTRVEQAPVVHGPVEDLTAIEAAPPELHASRSPELQPWDEHIAGRRVVRYGGGRSGLSYAILGQPNAGPTFNVDDAGRLTYESCRGVVSGREFVAMCGGRLLFGVLHSSGTFVAANAYALIGEQQGEYGSLSDFASDDGLVVAALEAVMWVASDCGDASGANTMNRADVVWWRDIDAAAIAARVCTLELCGSARFGRLLVTSALASTNVVAGETAEMAAYDHYYDHDPVWNITGTCMGLRCSFPLGWSRERQVLAGWVVGRATRDGSPMLQQGDALGFVGQRTTDFRACPSDEAVRAARDSALYVRPGW